MVPVYDHQQIPTLDASANDGSSECTTHIHSLEITIEDLMFDILPVLNKASDSQRCCRFAVLFR